MPCQARPGRAADRQDRSGGGDCGRYAAGFTILELTVALVMLGSLSLVALGAWRRDAGPNAAILAREAALALRRTRAVALATNRPAGSVSLRGKTQ